jgi:hypothetical protein
MGTGANPSHSSNPPGRLADAFASLGAESPNRPPGGVLFFRNDLASPSCAASSGQATADTSAKKFWSL